MQPYFIPYIGYFQLLNAVDQFVIYDNIQFTKKGWIHRNRLLINGKDEYVSLPLRKGSDYLSVDQRYLADIYPTEKQKLLRKIQASYQKAPYFNDVFPLISAILDFEDQNLFQFNYNSVKEISRYLGIDTPIVVSSTIDIDHDLKGKDKVIAICKALNTTKYINSIGGTGLYDKDEFLEQGIDLQFIKTQPIEYRQFKNEFIPFLSILDVMMFNDKETICKYLCQYEIV